MTTEQTYTLADVVDEYLISRQIEKKKYYAGYLITAKKVWRYLFQNTIYATQSQWLPLKSENPYNYIEVPIGTTRIFSVAKTNHCGNIVPLYYNQEANVIPMPTMGACGCTQCGCAGGLCDDINSVTKTTKLLFTVNGVDYYQITWIKLCPNGDIIQYDQIPTKKFNSYAGDGGDYNTDYNNDYLIGNPPFSDFTIETITQQKVICNIPMLPCGCPVNNTQTQTTFFNACGSIFCANSCCYKEYCGHLLSGATNYDPCDGSVKISDCLDKIYFIPNQIPFNNNGQQPPLPTYLLLNSQTSGENCGSEVIVPNNEACLDALSFGIDYYQKRFNNKFSAVEKQEAKYGWNNAVNELIKFLNPLSLEQNANVQDVVIRW